MKKTFPLIIITLIFVFSSFVQHNVNSQPTTLEIPDISSLNRSRIIKDINFFSSLGSRVTGYPGSYLAADYIYETFNRLGLNPIVQNFTVVNAIDGNDSIIVTVNGHSYLLKAYSLWPNLVQACKTPESGISGRLIYVGRGTYQELNGKAINNSIVLMDFNSSNNWVNVAALGAKGIIFIEPKESNYAEARSKFLLTPVYIPRLYISSNESKILLKLLSSNNEVYATIKNEMEFKTVVGQNIIGILRGTEFPNEVIVVSAHYDTWSVVPAIAPSEDEATSVSTLLEFARFFVNNPPKRTIWFVVFSGHYQGLAGARAFVDKYFYSDEVVNGSLKILAQIDLDLSTESRSVSFLSQGFFYRYGSTTIETKWTGWLQSKLQDLVSLANSKLEKELNVLTTFGFSSVGWWGSQVTPYILDSEPLSMAHGLGFSIRTDGLRFYFGLPLKQNVNYNNLWPQAYLSLITVFGLANSPDWKIQWSQVSPAISGKSRTLIAAGATDVAGFITVNGRVVTFNITKGWYDPLPNAIVAIFPGGLGYTNYPFQILYTFSDSKGNFQVKGLGYGLAPSIGYYTFLPFKINEKTGLIEYAPDFGQYGAQSIPNGYQLTVDPINVTAVAFKANAVVLFNIFDYQAQRPLIFRDPRMPTNVWLSTRFSVSLLNARTLGPDISWGYFIVPDDGILVVYTQPHARFITTVTIGPLLTLEVLFTNTSTFSVPPYDFSGYESKENEELHYNALFESSKNLFTTSNNRFVVLKSSNVWNPLIESSLSDAISYRELLNASLKSFNYLLAMQASSALVSLSSKAYVGVMGLINDVPVSSIFIIAFLALFSFLVSATFFSAQGTKLVLSSVVSFITLTTLFYFVNPIFKVAANFLMAPLSVIIVLFFLLVTFLFSSEASTTLKEIRTRIIGAHYVEKGLTSFTLITFPYAIEQMKKRKLRTFLVMFSIASVVYAFVSLTSISVYQAVLPSPVLGGQINYNGVLIKTEILQQPSGAFDYNLLTILSQFSNSCIIAPRVWWYPESIAGRRVTTALISNSSTYSVSAVIGLTPNEYYVYNYSKALVSSLTIGNSRWFNDEDYYSAIIPYEAANQLKVKVGDTILFEGLKLKVIGVVNSSVLNRFVDFDGYLDTPVYPILPSLILGVTLEPTYAPTQWNLVLIVPYKLAKDLGGYLASISLVTKDANDAQAIARKIASIYSIPLYVSSESGPEFYSPVISYGSSGMSIALPLIVIGAASISAAILGSVKERGKELYVYSAVGLPPSGSALIFITEAIIISILSIVPAYFLGIVTNSVLISGKLLPENFTLNATSISVIVAILAGVASTLLAMAYPIYLASKLITPSLERRWKIPTKPKGNVWEIPLPFSLTEEREVNGVYVFLEEYFKAHSSETPDPFIVRSVKTDIKNKVQELLVSLMPLESGVYQRATISSKFYEDARRFDFVLRLEKIEGTPDTWVALNYNFIDAVRKQLLTWRFISEQDRVKYINLAEKIVR